MMIESKYDIGELVYLRHDPEQEVRMVTEITIKPGPFVIYQLSRGVSASYHYEVEITEEKTLV